MSLSKLAFLSMILISSISNSEAAIAIPDSTGTFTVFQEEYAFFGCTEDELSTSLVNPIHCGNRSIEKKTKTINFERKLFQELKDMRPVKEMSAKKDDYKKMNRLTYQKDFLMIRALEKVARNLEVPFTCGLAVNKGVNDCPQLFQDWTLVSVSTQSGELWRDNRTGLVWSEINFKSFNYAGAAAFCESQPILKFRLATVEEAQQAQKNNLLDHTNCGQFYDQCKVRWIWSQSPTPYGHHWVYSQSGNFMKLLNMDHTGASVRCVAETI